MQVTQLQTHFPDRNTLVEYVHQQFPKAAQRSPEISPVRGGRGTAEQLIQQIQPDRYASTRNDIDGAVTHLSPYLRHGIVTLAEVRHFILKQHSARRAHKLLQELAWRDYFQRVYERLGNDIWRDIEPYKTGVRRYAQDLPTDIAEGTTGAACIDAFSHDLRTTGYLHNHARMWLAAYTVHHRRIRWQAGAFWFLQHLLDGDPASNNLSWQWVASTFASKPYFFNRDNLAHYTHNNYCSTCPLAHRGCPFEGTYEDIAHRLFAETASQAENSSSEQTPLTQRLRGNYQTSHTDTISHNQVEANSYILWVNEESLNPHNPVLSTYTQHPHAKAIFVFDEAAIEAAQWSLKRIVFLYESLLEIPGIHIYHGSTVNILTSLIEEQRLQYGSVVLATTQVVDPRLKQLLSSLKKFVPIELHDIKPYVPTQRIRDLRRFSRYWKEVEARIINSHNDDSV